MSTRDNRKSGKIYRRYIKQQAEEDLQYEDEQDVYPGPSRIVMRQIVDVEPIIGRDERANDLGTELDHQSGNQQAVEADAVEVEREYRSAHDCTDHEDVADCLRDWAVDHEEPRSSVNEILAIFRTRTDYELPMDARTLMQTSTTIGQEIEEVAGGEYWYKGIKNVLRNYFRSSTPETDRISVQVSVDGLPLHKSSSTQVWPILMKMEQIQEPPIMMIAMFCGSSKPNDLEPFLRPFVVEANELIQTGIQFGDKNVRFNIRAIIADSPARAFLKAITSFNGLHGCLKCTCVGEYLRRERKVIFDSVGANPRTDSGFRSRECPEHHQRWRSPLEDLINFNIVDDVVVGDRLHLIDLGVTRKILRGFLDGKFKNLPRWSHPEIKKASKVLRKMKLPIEVHRGMRGFNDLKNWKGTEYRSFLHYTSLVVLQDLLTEKAFDHFLLYFCGITILLSAYHRKYWPKAGEFLDKFVKEFGSIYGREHLTSNVHNLQHVAAEVLKFGHLDNFSTYCFENHLQKIKRWVRSGFRCAVQVAARSEEKAKRDAARRRRVQRYPKLTINRAGIFVIAQFLLRPTLRDQWVLSKKNAVIKFNKVQRNPPYTIVGTQFHFAMEMFNFSLAGEDSDFQFSSANIHVYEVNEAIPTKQVEISVTQIRCKLVAVHPPSQPGTTYLFPLLHTL